MKTPIARVNIDSMSVVEANMRVEHQPAESMGLRMSVNLDSTSFDNSSDEEYRYSLVLRVIAELLNNDDDEDVRMSLMACVDTTVSTSTDDITEEEAASYLLLNGVSMAYAHARSYLMTLTALSPMRPFVIPPIVPQVFIEQVLENNQE
ncbi:hypothetical protein ACUYFE_01365 [Olegusella massiliensis]|uniref:hypothetical protein n=1 Tax=Olegusella massiliensis TaxID=1776381 RepID=UPI0040558A86